MEKIDKEFEEIENSGKSIDFEVSGEKRSVNLWRGVDGDYMLIFMRGDVKTELRLSKDAAEAMIALFIDDGQIISNIDEG